MKSFTSLGLVFCFFSGCSAPDISANLTALSQAEDLSSKEINALYADAAKAEAEAAEAQLIANHSAVFTTTGNCELVAARAKLEATSNCTLIRLAKKNAGPINATQIIVGMEVIGNYIDVITEIATTESGAKVKTLTEGLIVSMQRFSETIDDGTLKTLTRISKEDSDLISATAGYLTDQYRIAHLRRAVRKADPIIKKIIVDITGDIDRGSVSSIGSYRTMVNAKNLMITSQLSKSPDYAQRVKDYEEAFKAYAESEKASPVNHLILLYAAHADLLAALNNPNAEGIVTSLETINTIYHLAQKSKE